MRRSFPVERSQHRKEPSAKATIAEEPSLPSVTPRRFTLSEVVPSIGQEWSRSPVFRFQRWTVFGESTPAARNDPSGETASDQTRPSWGRLLVGRPVARSQIRTVQSSLPEISVLPSGGNARACTAPRWASGVARRSLPVARSQKWRDSWAQIAASDRPSGENAIGVSQPQTAFTRLASFPNESISFPLLASKSTSGPWYPSAARSFPSGEKRT